MNLPWFRVAKFPSPSSISPASTRAWTLATAAYIFCWAVQIFGIFILYELAFSFYRRWRTSQYHQALDIISLLTEQQNGL